MADIDGLIPVVHDACSAVDSLVGGWGTRLAMRGQVSRGVKKV